MKTSSSKTLPAASEKDATRQATDREAVLALALSRVSAQRDDLLAAFKKLVDESEREQDANEFANFALMVARDQVSAHHQ